MAEFGRWDYVIRFARKSWVLLVALAIAAGCGQSAADQATVESAPSPATDSAWLYVQSAGDVSAREDGDQWVVSLADVSPITTGFTDRPDRRSRHIATADFVVAWDAVFGDDPPNAALGLLGGEGRTIPLTISDVARAPATGELEYTVSLLDGADAGLLETEDLGPGSLFIDDAAAFPTSLTSSQISLQIHDLDREPSLVYRGLQGNQPIDYGNSVLVWRGSKADLSAAPFSVTRLEAGPPSGSLTPRVPDGTYTVGYATGPDPSTTAATVVVEANRAGPSEAVAIQPVQVGSRSLIASYRLPSGVGAEKGHWVGLFDGPASAELFNARPLTRESVTGIAPGGTVELSAPLQRGREYVVGYFTGPGQTTLAATASFTP